MNILFFPGSFSPFTDGHYGIIERYIRAAKSARKPLDRIFIVMSSKDREGIRTEDVLGFVRKVYEGNDAVVPMTVSGSPITAVYRMLNILAGKDAEFEVALVRSEKDGDDISSEFRKHIEDDKKRFTNITPLELEVSDEPLLYKTRNDDMDNKPVSASTVRDDLRNNDFRKFVSSYRRILKSESNNITIQDLKEYFKKWKSEVSEKEDDDKKK